jgi:ABC-type polysaccharide/polyol phosphate export permease
MRLLLYSSPVIYPLSFVPVDLQTYYLMNPFAVLFALVQSCFLGLTFPPLPYVAWCAAFFIVLLLGAHMMYARRSPNFTKVI